MKLMQSKLKKWEPGSLINIQQKIALRTYKWPSAVADIFLKGAQVLSLRKALWKAASSSLFRAYNRGMQLAMIFVMGSM